MPLPPGLSSPRQVLAHYSTLYDRQISTQQAYPFIYPLASGGAFIVILYLLMDHRKSPFLTWCRYPVFTFLLLFESWTVWCNRARSPTIGFGIGLCAAFGTLWCFTVMCACDCQVEFYRVERRKDGGGDRRGLNGNAEGGKMKRRSVLYWQEYPRDLGQRLDWIIDMFFSFRGVGWNWQIAQIPPLPEALSRELSSEPPEDPTPALTLLSPTSTTPPQILTSRQGIRRYTTPGPLLTSSLLTFLLTTLILDIIKTTMSLDPYFWGYVSPLHSTSTPNGPASIPPPLLKPYRLAISYIGILTALNQVLSLGPLIFPLLPHTFLGGMKSHAVMNPLDFFGSWRNVWRSGLQGWWGGFWHQTFRVAFEKPADVLVRRLGVSKRGWMGKMVGCVVAFGLSGVLHAAGSATQLGDTRPLQGALAFFLWQVVGVGIEEVVVEIILIRQCGLKKEGWVLGVWNLMYAHVWLYFTAPLLVDDFARGGVWLYEPVPISPLRGLGFGNVEERGWVQWREFPLRWYRGKSWWDSGIAF